MYAINVGIATSKITSKITKTGDNIESFLYSPIQLAKCLIIFSFLPPISLLVCTDTNYFFHHTLLLDWL